MPPRAPPARASGRTLLATPEGTYKSVGALRVGDQVEGSGGRPLDVAFVQRHRRAVQRLVTLQTAQAKVTVTPDHRIAVPEQDRGLAPAAAIVQCPRREPSYFMLSVMFM